MGRRDDNFDAESIQTDELNNVEHVRGASGDGISGPVDTAISSFTDGGRVVVDPIDGGGKYKWDTDKTFDLESIGGSVEIHVHGGVEIEYTGSGTAITFKSTATTGRSFELIGGDWTAPAGNDPSNCFKVEDVAGFVLRPRYVQDFTNSSSSARAFYISNSTNFSSQYEVGGIVLNTDIGYESDGAGAHNGSLLDCRKIQYNTYGYRFSGGDHFHSVVMKPDLFPNSDGSTGISVAVDMEKSTIYNPLIEDTGSNATTTGIEVDSAALGSADEAPMVINPRFVSLDTDIDDTDGKLARIVHDNNGELSVPEGFTEPNFSQVAARVFQTSSDTISSGSVTQLTFDSDDGYPSGDVLTEDSSNDKITIEQNGVYHVEGMVAFGSPGDGSRISGLLKQGSTTEAQMENTSGANNNTGVNPSTVMHVTSAPVDVTFDVFQDSGSGKATQGSEERGYLTVVKLG